MTSLFILNTTMADGRLVCAGAVEDVSDKDARLLIALGDAVTLEDAPPASAAEPCYVVSHKDGTHTVTTEPPKARKRR